VENKTNEELKDKEEIVEEETVSVDTEDITIENLDVEKELGDDSEPENDMEPAFKIKQIENKLAEQEDALKRVNAEYANFRRRTSEERDTIALYANEKVMNELLPVLDNFERALDAVEDKEDNLYKGVDMIRIQLIEALKKSGLEKIDAQAGVDFDPNFHMAVMQEESSEYEAGKILMELQPGYKLGKKVLRASMVKVSC